MLPTIIAAQRPHFQALAGAWLDGGANSFVVVFENKPIAWWPTHADPSRVTLVENLWLGRKKIGELRVDGPNSRAARAQLQAEAVLLSSLIESSNNLNSVTSQLIDTQDQLLAMYDLTQTMREDVDFNKMLYQLASETTRLVKVDAAFMMVQKTGQPWLIEESPASAFKPETIESLLALVQETGHDLLLSGEEAREQFSNFRNLLLLPIQIRSSAKAALGLVNKTGGDFLSPDIKLARAIAEHAGARIENALLYQRNLEQAKLQTEMELAQRVQLNLLPRRQPAVKGIDFWASSRPALQVGGDFYDFLQREGWPFTFTVGDISGKGLSAALLMSMTRSVIRTKAHDFPAPSPELVVGWSNEELYEDFTEVSMFATVFVGQYEANSREMLYANAGHSPVIYYPRGGQARLLEADGTAVGILPTSFSENQRIRFEPGDVLIVATDGLSEAYNTQNEMFGYDRLLELTEALADKSAQEIANDLYDTVNEFSAGKPQDDDQTVMVLKGTKH